MLGFILGVALAAQPTWTYTDTVPEGFELPGVQLTDTEPDVPGVQVNMEVRVWGRHLSLSVVGASDGMPVQVPILELPNFGAVSYVAPACGRVWIGGRHDRVSYLWLGDVFAWAPKVAPLTPCPEFDLTEILGGVGPVPGQGTALFVR